MGIPRVAAFLCVSALAVASCGGGSTATSAGPASVRASSGPPAPAPTAIDVGSSEPTSPPTATGPGGGGSGGDAGSFTLVVQGGTLAGTYRADSPTGGCFVNNGQLQLALEAPGAGPDGMDLFVSINSPLGQATAGTNDFLLTATFGSSEQNGTVASYPAPSGKDGNLKATDGGSTITAAANGSLFGVAGDGSSQTMKIQAQATCAVLGRM